jgi:hypothetical protein
MSAATAVGAALFDIDAEFTVFNRRFDLSFLVKLKQGGDL